MNGRSAPLSEADIIAARVRAAEGGVPWDRAKALSEARQIVAAKQALRRRRRNRIILASLGTLLAFLALLGWVWTRR